MWLVFFRGTLSLSNSLSIRCISLAEVVFLRRLCRLWLCLQPLRAACTHTVTALTLYRLCLTSPHPPSSSSSSVSGRPRTVGLYPLCATGQHQQQQTFGEEKKAGPRPLICALLRSVWTCLEGKAGPSGVVQSSAIIHCLDTPEPPTPLSPPPPPPNPPVLLCSALLVWMLDCGVDGAGLV